MTKPVYFLFAVAASFFFLGCNNSEKRSETDNYSTLPKNKTDSISKINNDSLQVKDQDTIAQEKKIQAPSAAFNKILTFKNIAFSVKAIGKGSLQQVTIQPSGLTATNRAETLETEPVTGAEIGDLNADGYPELLIYTQSAGSGSYGKVIAFSVNNGKSMSQVNFPETSQNPELKKGYAGHDKFTIKNNKLTQEFPIYQEGDVNSKPTGKKRQITYKLKNGADSRFFEVDLVKEVSGK